MIPGDGIPLISAAHPRQPWYRRLWTRLCRPKLSEDSLEDICIEILNDPSHKPPQYRYHHGSLPGLRQDPHTDSKRR
jgi:hypothetical protein